MTLAKENISMYLFFCFINAEIDIPCCSFGYFCCLTINVDFTVAFVLSVWREASVHNKCWFLCCYLSFVWRETCTKKATISGPSWKTVPKSKSSSALQQESSAAAKSWVHLQQIPSKKACNLLYYNAECLFRSLINVFKNWHISLVCCIIKNDLGVITFPTLLEF